jgi:hypothetical protein
MGRAQQEAMRAAGHDLQQGGLQHSLAPLQQR